MHSGELEAPPALDRAAHLGNAPLGALAPGLLFGEGGKAALKRPPVRGAAKSGVCWPIFRVTRCFSQPWRSKAPRVLKKCVHVDLSMFAI